MENKVCDHQICNKKYKNKKCTRIKDKKSIDRQFALNEKPVPVYRSKHKI